MRAYRTDSGLEDRDCEERGTAVFHEDVHGLTALLYLPPEVCVTSQTLYSEAPKEFKKSLVDPVLPLIFEGYNFP